MITARARADTVEGFRWLAQRSPQAAARWYVGLQKALDKLKDNPGIHPIAEDESEQLGLTLRQMLYGRRRGTYRILYCVEADQVTVHAIRHSARGPIEP